MKNIATLLSFILCTGCLANAQVVKLTNITEATIGLQVGKTTKITSFQSEELKETRRGHKFPAPRLATSLGVTLWDMLYVGPGVAYTFQPGDDDNGYSHQVSAFAQTRLSIGKSGVRPFLDFKGGYHFADWEQTSQLFDRDWYRWDGFFLEPALGLSFSLSERTSLNGSIGYQYVNAGNRIRQSLMTDSGEPIVDAALNETYHRFLLTIGFTFK